MTYGSGSVWLSYQGYVVKSSGEQLRMASEEEMLGLSEWMEGIGSARVELQDNTKGFVILDHGDTPDLTAHKEPTVGNSEGAVEPEVEIRRRHRPLDVDDENAIGKHLPPIQQIIGRPVLDAPETKDSATGTPGSGIPTMLAPGGESLAVQPDPVVRKSRRVQGRHPEFQEVQNPLALPAGAVGQEAMDLATQSKRDLDLTPSQEIQAKRTCGEVREVRAMLASLKAMAAKQRKKVKLKDVDFKDLEKFRKAAIKEWTHNLSVGAYEIIAPVEAEKIRQTKVERIMKSRMLYTRKPVEPQDLERLRAEGLLLKDQGDGPCKAKCRWIANGSSDPDALEAPSMTPAVSRHALHLALQVMASKKFVPHFADFSQAFMSGDQITRELYCELLGAGIISELDGVQKGSWIRILKTVYGLTDGPFAWNRHLDRRFNLMGHKPSDCDSCVYLLHTANGVEGIICVATDDMLHAGTRNHHLKMDQLKSMYSFGKWEKERGMFCGKWVALQPSG